MHFYCHKKLYKPSILKPDLQEKCEIKPLILLRITNHTSTTFNHNVQWKVQFKYLLPSCVHTLNASSNKVIMRANKLIAQCTVEVFDLWTFFLDESIELILKCWLLIAR